MKRSSGKTYLQNRFNLFICLGIFLWMVTIPFVFFEVHNMNRHIVNLELSGDIYDTILEMRRYEKNFLLYGNLDDLRSTIFYSEKAKDLLSARAGEFEAPGYDSDFVQLKKGLKDYGNVIDILKKLSTSNSPDEKSQMEIRPVGKSIVELAESMMRAERGRVKKVAKRALWWPPIFMGGMLLLFIAGATMMTKNMIRPLGEIERATEKIAEGDFRPISHNGKIRGPADHLVAAFNRMAQELEAREEQIIHSRKISSLGTLVSGTAHELNNPINNIALTVDTLVGGRPISEERRKQLLNDILTQALRASEIVKNLLEFSRSQMSNSENLDLAELLRQTLKIAQNQITVSQIKLQDEISGDLPRITGHRQGLQQVFLNLITNAVQAMPGGGELHISAATREDNRIKIDFRDTGTGISEQNLPHIFDPFFTTKAVGKGTGLGLAVSYGIIKKHGGQITVKSAEGKGTTFTIVLPVK